MIAFVTSIGEGKELNSKGDRKGQKGWWEEAGREEEEASRVAGRGRKGGSKGQEG